MVTIPQTRLDRARITEHMRFLCEEIGARPAGGSGETHAAAYVRAQLAEMGIADLREQPFQMPSSRLPSTLPYFVGTVAGAWLGMGGRLGKLVGGALLLGSAWGMRETWMGRAPAAAALFAHSSSTNVIARIPAREKPRRLLYLVAHLDTGRDRIMTPFLIRSMTESNHTGALVTSILGGLSLLFGALRGRKRFPIVAATAGVLALVTGAAAVYEEIQPHSEGANNGASGIAALLEVARILAADPLPHTDVTILFVGSEETLNAGLERYLDQYAPSRDLSTWINLDAVGAGAPCYVVRGGVSRFAEYRPTPKVTALAAKISRKRPELRLYGAALTTLDAVSVLVARGYEAIRIGSTNGTGHVPYWNRATDRLDVIEPNVIERAGEFALELARALDAQGK